VQSASGERSWQARSSSDLGRVTRQGTGPLHPHILASLFSCAPEPVFAHIQILTNIQARKDAPFPEMGKILEMGIRKR